jgi:hypothetical protein
MTLRELLKRRKDSLASNCPQCAAINDLCSRISLARLNPELAEYVPEWEDGINKLRTIKIQDIQTIMDEMPTAVKKEAVLESPPLIQKEEDNG